MKSKITASVVLAMLLLFIGGAVFSQVSVTLLPPIWTYFVDANGHPLSGGKVYTCVHGATCGDDPPSNPQLTYQDFAGTTPNTDPIILDQAGRANIFIASTPYDIVVKDKFGNVVKSALGILSPSLGNIVPYQFSGISKATGISDGVRVAINNCPISVEYGGGTFNVLQALVGCIQAPVNSIIGGVSSGLSGYSIGGAGTANTPAVGVFGTCIVGGDNNAGCWGANFAGTNVDLLGIGHAVSVWGIESDCNTTTGAGGHPAANCWGVAAVASAASQPTGAFDAFDARITPGSAFPWKNGFTSEPGAAQVAIEIWPVGAPGVHNSPSQPIQEVAWDPSGNPLLNNQYEDTAGNFIFIPGLAGGGMNLSPMTNVSVNSPPYIMTAFNGSSVQMVTEVFGDPQGDVNLSPAPGSTGNVVATRGHFQGNLFTPPSSSSACFPGAFADDANFHYVCVSNSVWKRVALSTF